MALEDSQGWKECVTSALIELTGAHLEKTQADILTRLRTAAYDIGKAIDALKSDASPKH
jgi:hypothetical protein